MGCGSGPAAAFGGKGGVEWRQVKEQLECGAAGGGEGGGKCLEGRSGRGTDGWAWRQLQQLEMGYSAWQLHHCQQHQEQQQH
jgi:hypothetical protein